MSSSISITAMKRGCGIAAEHKRLIRNVCRAVIAAELNGTPCVVDIHATDDAGIREINLDRRNVDKPTDVLSFPMFDLQPNEQPKPQLWELQDGRIFLGDIVISAERAAAQAREYGHSTERELAFLTAHAMLHLLGYDHERSKADETLHFSKQEAVLRELGVAR